MDSQSLKTAIFNKSHVGYYSFGVGSQALVFVHGWTCDSSLWYMQQTLFNRYRSLLIDLPGHGTSGTPHLEYSQELFARSIRTILEAEDISRAVLVGHSMGGPVSTMFLRLFPNLVAGIVYVDSFFHSPETYLSGIQRRELAERLQDKSKFADLLTSFWTELTTSEIRTKVAKTMLGTESHVRVNAVTSDSLPHAFHWDEIFDIPALLIATPFRANIDAFWLHHLPKLNIVTWENHGHFLFMEDAERFNNEVETFLTLHGLLNA